MEPISTRRPRVIRLAFVVAVVAANVWAAQWVTRAPYLSVVPSLRAAASTTLWASVYVVAYSAWKGRCSLPPGIKEVPAMTLHSVVAYIYGLGLIVFATILATLGFSSPASLNFVCGMTAVCLSDTLERAHEPWFQRVAVASAGVSAAVAVHLIADGEPHFREYAVAVERRDPVALAYGLAIPLLAPFGFYLTRRHSYCSPALVCELIGFAFPFAGLLSALIMCTLPLEPGAADVPNTWALPLFCLPVLFFGVQTALLFSTVDFLCALALALATKHFAAAGDAPDAVLALCFAGVAFLLRLCTCLHRDDEDGRAMCGQPSADEAPPAQALPQKIDIQPPGCPDAV